MTQNPTGQTINPAMSALYGRLLAEADRAPDQPLTRVVVGQHLVAVVGEAGSGANSPARGPEAGPGAGLASRLSRGAPETPPAAKLPQTLRGLAAWLAEPPTLFNGVADARALGLAALNALLPVPAEAAPMKMQELLGEAGRGRHVVVVGHFPFVERMGDAFARFTVLELLPKPGDTPAHAAPEVLPQADVVALTGTSLSNGTLAGLLELIRPEALVCMLGPSTPLARTLLDAGVRWLGGATVRNAEAALSGVAAGKPFRHLEGVASLVWRKSP